MGLEPRQMGVGRAKTLKTGIGLQAKRSFVKMALA